MKEFRVEIQQGAKMNEALITQYRHEAETYFDNAKQWNRTHGTNRRIRLVAYNGNHFDEIIRDTRDDAVLMTADREWLEDEQGEPIRVFPKLNN